MHVGSNSLKELPAGLAHAACLLTLDASCNQLFSLQPDMLSGLSNLTSLKLSQNLLEGQLPPEIGCLTRCCNCKPAWRILERLGGCADFTGMHRLELLDLSQNGLLTLPPSLGRCTALVELLLGNNQLTCIPDEAGQLSSLRTLDLGRNRRACIAACALSRA